jgi:apolipoprotein N-acyltransferase
LPLGSPERAGDSRPSPAPYTIHRADALKWLAVLGLWFVIMAGPDGLYWIGAALFHAMPPWLNPSVVVMFGFVFVLAAPWVSRKLSYGRLIPAISRRFGYGGD